MFCGAWQNKFNSYTIFIQLGENKITNFRRAGRRVGLKCSKYLPAIDSSVATPANFSSFESFDMESLLFKFVSCNNNKNYFGTCAELKI